MKDLGIRWAIRIVMVAIFVGAWQIAISTKFANRVFVGDPEGTIKAFFAQFNTTIVTVDLRYTVYETLAGFAIASVAGTLAGIVLVGAPRLREAVSPLVTAANSLPRIALAPLFILWFGLGMEAKIALVISFVFFVMLMTTIAGFTQPNGDFELLAASLGASPTQKAMLFLFPGAIPTLLAGLELSLIYSFLGAVSGEIVGGSHGLGVQLTAFSNSFEIDKFLAILLLLIIVSTFAVQLMRFVTSPLTRWHRAEMGSRVESG